MQTSHTSEALKQSPPPGAKADGWLCQTWAKKKKKKMLKITKTGATFSISFLLIPPFPPKMPMIPLFSRQKSDFARKTPYKDKRAREVMLTWTIMEYQVYRMQILALQRVSWLVEVITSRCEKQLDTSQADRAADLRPLGWACPRLPLFIHKTDLD